MLLLIAYKYEKQGLHSQPLTFVPLPSAWVSGHSEYKLIPIRVFICLQFLDYCFFHYFLLYKSCDEKKKKKKKLQQYDWIHSMIPCI